MSLLALIVSLPLITAVIQLAVPRHYRVLHRVLPLLATALTAGLAGILFLRFDPEVGGYQFVTRLAGLGAPSLGIEASLGVDGLSVALILMGAVVAFAAACTTWEIQEREKEFQVLLLLITGGILAAFASLDVFFFYFFHELALIPTFIMIGIWGRGEDRVYAAFKMTLYLSLGALILLAGLIALYVTAGVSTFSFLHLTEVLQRQPLDEAAQHAIFPLLLFGFGILVSLWPFHTWAPLGYRAAPTATAMLHAGVLKKFGLYGLIRLGLPFFPDASRPWLNVLAALCLGNILWCGLVALRQRNLNSLLGNSSVAHMGFAFLGIASLSLIGVTGAVVVMVAHGFLAALSFGLSGHLLHSTRTLEMSELGGLARRLPFVGTALVMALLAGCGLPGFANFVGEVMVFFGAWESYLEWTVLACWGGLVIGGVTMVRAIRTMLHGPLPERWNGLSDANAWRRVPFVILLAALFLFGVYPRLLTDRIQPATAEVVRSAGGMHVTEAPREPRAPMLIAAEGTSAAARGEVPE
jgi:NADH-quinone oxidoreductase subunit M